MIWQAEEASGIFERLGDLVQQAECLVNLASLLMQDEQLDAAEETALRAMDLLPEEGEQFQVFHSRRVLGMIYQSKGEMKKAVFHLETALDIASALHSVEDLFWAHYNLTEIFFDQGRLTDAQTHLRHAKSFAANGIYLLACTSFRQASLWYKQDMFGEAKSEALAALDVFEKLGSTDNAELTRRLLEQIDAQWPDQPGDP